MIIWGFKVRFQRLAGGVFFCPNCGGDRPYGRKQGRRWFTLFFIPVIPLGHVGEEFVECEACQQGYRMTVLNMPTSASLSESLLLASRQAVVAILRAAAIPGPAARAAALEVVSSTSGLPWGPEALDADLAGLRVSGLVDTLAVLGRSLNQNGKESFLAGCVRVAAAGGTVEAEQQRLLESFAHALGMTPAHARGVIAQVTEQAGS